jgi:fluoride exporter
MNLVLVGLFGAAGALCRYGIGVAAGSPSFPWATLAINVVGSFLLGLVLVAGPVKFDGTTTTAIAVGFLGAFTTFSTFSSETQAMLRDDRLGTAAVYVTASVVGGVAMAALGYLGGRAIVD